MSEIHKLLARQLKRNGVSGFSGEKERALLSSISNAYIENELEIELLENSLFLTSSELNERNETLKYQLAELTETKNQLQESVSVLNAMFDSTGEVIIVYDVNGVIAHTNSMGVDFFKENGVNDYQHWSAMLDILKFPDLAFHLKQKLERNLMQQLDGVLEFNNNRFFKYRSLPQVIEGELIGRVWCFRDVTLEKEREDLIEHQAYHDALTGLPNRNLLLDRVTHALTIAKRAGTQIAILFVDLDDFKRVNDTEGHKAGDELLIQLVSRIQTRIREQDTLSRLGGDEFVILLEAVEDIEKVKVLCEEFLSILSEPFVINGRQHFVSSSIGISLFPSHDHIAEQLILKADMAMYQAKQSGKNTFVLYDARLEKQAKLQVKIERELRKALKIGELQPYFQPKIDLKTNKIVGAEVLMRWFKSDGTSVPPDTFIPIAESTGLITQIGRYAIESAFTHLARWQETGQTDLKLAVNLSIIEFQDKELIQHILEIIDTSGIPGSRLIIELTESIFMENKDQISRIMQRLRSRGVAFALDDFGKGYSSFSYLQMLPIDYLKIDKSFLTDVCSNKQSAAIARTIIDIGHNLELGVIAEGIEDQQTLDYVTSEKCETAQGYFLYRPMNSQAFTRLLEVQET